MEFAFKYFFKRFIVVGLTQLNNEALWFNASGPNAGQDAPPTGVVVVYIGAGMPLLQMFVSPFLPFLIFPPSFLFLLSVLAS